MSDAMTFPVEWVTGQGDEPMQEGDVDEVLLLQSALNAQGIVWKLVPDPSATTFLTHGRRAYQIDGMTLTHSEAFAQFVR